ncbi:HAMP domain-containing protein [bacterium]|nr:HAMP domain-containing protein [bacterium]
MNKSIFPFRLNIRAKLVLAFMAIGIASTVVIGLQSFYSGKKALQQSSFDHLTSVRETKARQIETYFQSVTDQMLTMSENYMIVNAMRDFRAAFHGVRSEARYNDRDVDMYRDSMRDFYQQEYLTRLAANTGDSYSASTYLPPDDETLYLQYNYIYANSNAVGEKDNLTAAEDGTRYASAHRKYHPVIRSFLKKFSYYDIFLVDIDTGHIVYSVFKEVDYGTSLSSGPYAGTNFGEAFAQAQAANNPDYVTTVEFEGYDPSYGAPASFIASPVYDGNEKIGVLIFQIPIDIINGVMTGNEGWEQDGLGESGETYLVAGDRTMRSMSRFLIQDPDGYFTALRQNGYSSQAINHIRNQNTSILFQEINTVGVDNALAGRTGEEIIADYRNVPVLSSYRPLNIPGFEWVILSEIDKAEAFAPINALAMRILIWGLVIIAIIGVAAFLLANTLARPMVRLKEHAEDIALGRLDEDISIERDDEIGELADAFRSMQSGLREKATVARKIADGDLNVNVTLASNDDELGLAMQQMKDSIRDLQSEVQTIIDGIRDGNLDTRGNATKFKGGWSDLVEGLNDLVTAFVQPLIMIQNNLKRMAEGDVPDAVTDEYRGDFQEIRNNLNACIHAIDTLVADSKSMVNAAVKGELKQRANVDVHNGDYQSIIAGFNETLDRVLEPINKASEVLSAMANGDLSLLVDGDFKGDHATIQTSLNDTLQSLNDLLSQTLVAIDQVNEGAQQLSESSQSLSDGANQQAASLEEISSSITEVESQTRQNEDNAAQAAQHASAVRKAAETGDSRMTQMLEAMGLINESSLEVAKIIKVIDEIAFQTNLLALNAAVEAARAGVHGKGFAVVAEEVRNLAQRSARAANETTELISQSTDKTKAGVSIANETAEALKEIVKGINDVSELANEIHASSREQTQGIAQISGAMGTVDAITQQNSANAEEGAATAEELSNQATLLREMIGRFNLRDQGGSTRTRHTWEGEEITADNPEQVVTAHHGNGHRKANGNGNGNGNSHRIQPEDVIQLDDNEFGDF